MNTQRKVALGVKSVSTNLDNRFEEELEKIRPISFLRMISQEAKTQKDNHCADIEPATDWSDLVESIQIVSKHSKEIELEADKQKLFFQNLMEEMNQNIADCENRVRTAENLVQEEREIAKAQILAAEERARSAEDRALAAEEWLRRVQDTMKAEFSDLLTWKNT